MGTSRLQTWLLKSAGAEVSSAAATEEHGALLLTLRVSTDRSVRQAGSGRAAADDQLCGNALRTAQIAWVSRGKQGGEQGLVVSLKAITTCNINKGCVTLVSGPTLADTDVRGSGLRHPASRAVQTALRMITGVGASSAMVLKIQ